MSASVCAMLVSGLTYFMLLLSLDTLVSATTSDCKVFHHRTNLKIGASTVSQLVDLHIRHNLKGNVEIRDGKADSNDIEIRVETEAGSKEELDNIFSEKKLFESDSGKIFRLQVFSLSKSNAIPTIVGGLLGTVLLLMVICLAIWLYHKKNRNRPPLSRSRSNQVSQSMGFTERCSCGTGKRKTRKLSRIKREIRGFRTPSPRSARSPSTSPARSLHREGSQVRPNSPPQEETPQRRAAGRPHGLYKSTMMTFTLLSIATVIYASCLVESQVHVLVTLPTTSKLKSVQIVFSKKHPNEVKTSSWQHMNGTKLKIYDLPEVSSTLAPPCSADKICPEASKQDLAGCDSSTESCVCQRGYTMKNNICTDIDECESIPGICPEASTCHNSAGSYICDCGSGYYHQHGICRACSHACPIGQYESDPCSLTSDRVCSECQQCTGSMYEVKPCTTRRNRKCIHAAYPVLISGDETFPTFLQELKAESSSNVFLENLHNTKTLETSYYVTDTKQATDFFWYRKDDSEKIVVNIGISDVNLIAEYEDVDYESDAAFIRGDPKNTLEEKFRFKQVTDNYCRHPLPDFYSITLEISRDRTTKASKVKCSSKNANCPPNYAEGDTYIRRTLNQNCTKMGAFPKPLHSALNTLACMEPTSLLADVFNLTADPVHPVSTPSKRCGESIKKCKACIEQGHCQLLDFFDKTCCKLDCYSSAECKEAKSSHCSKTPVECAQGAAYTYTIQPVFENLKEEFMCHIKYRNPQILYKLWFYISIPHIGFETPRIHQTLYTKDVANLSHGFYNMEFITVEHSTGLQLKDDFILIGRKVAGRRSLNYTVHSKKQPVEYNNKKITVDEIQDKNIFVASIQFNVPFGYSTESWGKGNKCEKDSSKFRAVQKHYKDDGQNAYVLTQAVGEPYLYFVKSAGNRPYMRFIIPANISVLDWYFKEKGPFLKNGESVKAELLLSEDKKIWTLLLEGSVSHCPGYFGLTINDREEAEELFNYDVLVTCPLNFNVTFKVPNRGMATQKSFDMVIKDGKLQHRIFLSYMSYAETPEVILVGDKVANNSNPDKRLFLSIMAATAFILIGGLFLFAHLECTKQKSNSKNGFNYFERRRPNKSRENYCTAMKSLNRYQLTFVVIYLIYKIIYSIMFTFSVFFTLLFMNIHTEIQTIGKLQDIQIAKHNSSRNHSIAIEQQIQEEMFRQAKSIKQMEGACSHYMDEVVNTMLSQVETTSDSFVSSTKRRHMDVTSAMKWKIQILLDEYTQKIDNYTENYKKDFHETVGAMVRRYKGYLGEIYRSGWFMFPLGLFNVSTLFNEERNHEPLKLNDDGFSFSGREAAFLKFLQPDEVEEVEFQLKRFMERYHHSMPTLPSFNVPGETKSLCVREKLHYLRSMTNQQKVDAFKYMTSELAQDTTFSSGHDVDKSKAPSPQAHGVFSFQELLHELDFHILKIVFLCLDGLLLAYRFSHLVMNVRIFCFGFEEHVIMQDYKDEDSVVPLMLSERQQRELAEFSLATPDIYNEGHKSDSKSSKVPKHKVNGCAYSKKPQHTDSDSQTWRDKTTSTNRTPMFILKLYFQKMGQSVLVSKLILLAVIIILFYLLLRFFTGIFCMKQLEAFGIFRAYHTNLDIEIQAGRQFLENTTEIYSNYLQTHVSELFYTDFLQLKALLKYFDAEQDGLMKSLAAQVCSIQATIPTSHICNFTVEPTEPDIPMLPCNFLPLHSELRTGYDKVIFEEELLQDFEPVISSALHVIRVCVYSALSCGVLLLVLCFTGSLLYHFLRTRCKFATRKLYFVPSLAKPLTALSPDPMSDSDDDDAQVSQPAIGGEPSSISGSLPVNIRSKVNYNLKVQFSPLRTSPSRTDTLGSEFKYSETKV